MIGAIFLFFLLYLILLFLAAIVFVGGVYGGISLIAFKAHLITIMLGAGMIVLGVMVLAFFIKFVFSIKHNDNPQRIEITAEDQPHLLDFITQLAEETQTPVPQKIYLTPDVNAAVFYNSSFWSMFFPVRKNLEIGLGLVNSLSVSEFKAVIAHEFGHFSQRSMKLGSYVYTVNQVLFNLVYEYDRWDQWLDEWVDSGGVFGFFAVLTRGLIEGARAVLRWAYELVNKQYSGLSREMEYHADLVATGVAGQQAMISALRRVELSAAAYDHCTHYLNQLAEQGSKTEDLYANHRTTLVRLAEHLDLTVVQGLPRVLRREFGHLVKSRVKIKDQWASHPSREQREKNIRSLTTEVETDQQSAWQLFKNHAALRQQVTQRMYDVGLPKQELQPISAEAFAQYVVQEEERYQISPAFCGFYDNRFLQWFDPEEVVRQQHQTVELTFDMVYNEQHQRRIKEYFSNQNDFETLKAIQFGDLDAKYFEFDHRQYRSQEAGKIIRRLNSDLARQKLWLNELDQQSFLLHYRWAHRAGVAAEYLERYRVLMELQKVYESFSENQQQIGYWRDRLMTKRQWSELETQELTKELANVEASFKSHLRLCPVISRVTDMLSEPVYTELIPYRQGQQAFYLKVSSFDEEGFVRFTRLVSEVWTATQLAYQQHLKALTDYQLGLRVATAHNMAS